MFMVVPHYSFLVLKMPTQKGVLSLCGNILMAHTCKTSSYRAAEVLDLGLWMEDTSLDSKKLSLTEFVDPHKRPSADQ